MEITMRTDAGLESIRRVARGRPDMLVGAGTVLTLEQGKACVDAGARFIVSPGFDRTLAEWCLKNGTVITPGCVTPSEITGALSLGIGVVKFFPANVYGGLAAMKALAAPFGHIKFIPTGGVGPENLDVFSSAPFVHAVGGSWLCSKADVSAGNWERIERLSAEAARLLMGFEVRHLGVNCENDAEAGSVAYRFAALFGFDCRPGSSSIFAGDRIEVMRGRSLGTMGHIAVAVNQIARAAAYLEKRGVSVDWNTAKYRDGRCTAVYLREEAGGFAIRLLQK
jgi:2-dehydro-3-deoxyphosphogluconate aldolase/(4S)-4-hydroxy-2-oxoglutarate aldolase